MSDFSPPQPPPPFPPGPPQAGGFPPVPPVTDSMGRGLMIGLGWSAVAAVGGLLTTAIGIGAIVLLGIGLVQAAWMIPIRNRYHNRGQVETAKGILVAAGIVFLLNAGCWGTMLAMLAHTNFH